MDFSNNMTGIYSILLGSSTPGTSFSSASLIGLAGTAANISATGSSNLLGLLSGALDPCSYRFTLAEAAPAGGAAPSGNLTFAAAVRFRNPPAGR